MSASGLIKWVAALAASVLMLFVLTPIIVFMIVSAISRAAVDKGEPSDKRVAVIEVSGVIDDSRDIVEELYRQTNSKRVKGIVLRVDSPGGAVGPSQEIYGAVKLLKEKKPIVASMGTVAASGGLYSALGASKIYCQPGTLTGSIGVLLQVPNFTKISQTVGFEMITLTSGPLKDAGNPFREMSDSDRKFLQTTISTAYESFLKAVVDGRGLPEAEVRKFADGRLILGSQAVEYGLVDSIGGVYDAATESLKIAGISLEPGEVPELFYPLDKLKYVRKFLGAVSSLPSMFSSEMKLLYKMN